MPKHGTHRTAQPRQRDFSSVSSTLASQPSAIPNPKAKSPKPKAQPAAPRPPSSTSALRLPLELEQLILSTFSNAFTAPLLEPQPTTASSSRPPDTTSSQQSPAPSRPSAGNRLAGFRETVRSVKESLYQRDFEGAWESEERREAYALRWSVTRAACYASVAREWEDTLLPSLKAGQAKAEGDCAGEGVKGRRAGVRGQGQDEGDRIGEQGELRTVNGLYACGGEGGGNEAATKKTKTKTRVVCLGGGGGAELVALACSACTTPKTTAAAAPQRPHLQREDSWSELHLRDEAEVAGQEEQQPQMQMQWTRLLDITLVDSMDWSLVTEKLLHSLRYSKTLPPSSRPTEASFLQQDILVLPAPEIKSLFHEVKLVTICFTLNELYSTDMARTTAFLLHVTDALGVGAVVCVIDSPGSYSTVKLGKGSGCEEKRYPRAWLLDHTLLEIAQRGERGRGRGRKWEKVVSEQSRWFRWTKGLRYEVGVELEDMRFQAHVYRRL